MAPSTCLSLKFAAPLLRWELRITQKTKNPMLDKLKGPVTTLVIVMVALALHQKFIAPRIAPTAKKA